MSPLIHAPFFASLIISLLSAGAFDDVLKNIYERYPDEWEALDRPIGYFWAPNWRRFWSLTRGTPAWYLALLMLYNTPEFAKRDKTLLRRLSLYRRLFLTAVLLMVAWAALLLLLVDMA